MADVTITVQKRIAVVSGVKQRLVFNPPVDTVFLKKTGTGTLAYMVNAVEGDMTDIDEPNANTLDDTNSTRDLYKPNKITYLVIISSANMTLEIDTEKTERIV